MNRKGINSFWNILLGLLTVLAVAERISIYLDARSLMIDEANLAFNVVDQSYAGLFTTLDHAQYAPPLFLVAQKAAVDLLGVHEYALRLVPLCAGILTLLTLIWTGKKLIRTPYVVWVTALIGFSWYFLRYGTEVKQYASDTWLAVLAIGWAIHWPWHSLNAWRWIGWGVIGATLIWASMPIVFVLAGVGLYYAYVGWREHRQVKPLLPLLGVIALWMTSFGLYYFSLLAADIGSDYLQNYHAPFFFNPLVTDAAAAKAQYYLFQNLLATALPKNVTILAFCVALGGYGTWQLVRHQRPLAFLLITPIVITIAASMFHLYTLIPRVSLFILPFILLVMAIGAQQLAQRLPRIGQWIFGSMLMVVVVLQMNITYLWQPMYIDPLKPALQYIQDTSIEELVLVHFEAVPSYRFYSEYHEHAQQYRLPRAQLTAWGEFLPAVQAQQRKAQPFWVLIAHTPPEDVQALLQEWPTPTHSFILARAYAVRFQP